MFVQVSASELVPDHEHINGLGASSVPIDHVSLAFDVVAVNDAFDGYVAATPNSAMAATSTTAGLHGPDQNERARGIVA